MKVAAFIATVFALSGSAIAAPAPTHPKLQQSILTLQNEINTVINDISQARPADLKPDFTKGLKDFIALMTKLEGPQPCAPFRPGNPTTSDQAINYLHQSQASLWDLSLDLQDPSKSPAASSFHGNVCVAIDYYVACTDFVTSFRPST